MGPGWPRRTVGAGRRRRPELPPAGAMDVADWQDLRTKRRLSVRLPSGEPVLLLLRRRRVYALSNVCPHLGRALDDARVELGELRCAGHGWAWDLQSGRCRTPRGLRAPRLPKYDVWVNGGRVLIDTRTVSHPVGG